MQLSPNQKIFAQFLSAFAESIQNWKYLEKRDKPSRLFVSEIIDCKKQDYLNVQKAAYQNTYGQSTC